MAKKISEYKSVENIDSTAYIPIIVGDIPVNKKISADNLLKPLYDDIDTLSNQLDNKATISQSAVLINNILGSIDYNSPQPTPTRSGKYIFSSSGLCEWINSGTTVSINDELIVVYDQASESYEYTYIPIESSYVSKNEIDIINNKLNTKIDGGYADSGLLYLTIGGVPINEGIEVGSGGGGGGGTSLTNVEIRITTGYTGTFSVAAGADAILHYTFSSVYTSDGQQTGNGTAVYYVNGIQVAVQNIAQGEIEYNIGSKLISGTNRVSVSVTDAIGTSRVIQYTITSVSISISSSFDATTAYEGIIPFRYIPVGKQEKTIHFLIDNVEVGTQVTENSGSQFTFNLPAQTHGSHTLDVYAETTVGGVLISSNILHYDIIWIVAGNNTPIIASSFQPVTTVQYDTINIPYIVYTPNTITSSISYFVNGDELTSLSGITRNVQTWSYRTSVSGTTTMTIKCGVVEKQFEIPVAGSLVTSVAETNNLELYLTSAGRSNNETSYNTWEFGSISSNLSGFVYGTTDGWILDENGNTSLRLLGDARVDIPIYIFDNDFRQFGKTIEFDFKITDVMDYNSVVISCMSGNKGLEIQTQKATLKSEQTTLEIKFKENERIRLSFVIEELAENRLIYAYVNGVISSVMRYEIDDNFMQTNPVSLLIGSSYCTTNIYNIRVYDNNLSDNQILNNYIADIDNPDVKVNLFLRNQVFNEYGELEYDKILDQLPCMTITGKLPQFKGDKQNVDIIYEDKQNPSNSFILESKTGKTNIDVQGTSSQYYPRKNYKLSFGKAKLIQNGATVANSLYKLRPTSVPVPTFTVKADFAESTGTHNTGLAILADDILKGMDILTPPQKAQLEMSGNTIEDVNIRTTVDGFPIIIWHKETPTSELTFLGKYNFNIDKGSTDAFGFYTTTGNTTQSWEYLNNTSPRSLFRSNDFETTYYDEVDKEYKFEWINDFEARFPEDYFEINKFKDFVSWVMSTNPEQATNSGLTPSVVYNSITYTADTAEYRIAKFKDEATNHINIENLLSYYLITEIFGMVDQRAKNQFATTWGPESEGGDYIWYFILYDNDTSLGINNEGLNMFGYNIETHDHVDNNDPSSAYVWNGHNSLLWIQIENAFKDEIKAMYHEMRSKGVISYEVSIDTFNTKQSDKWCESIYNYDQKYKYIEPGIATGHNWTYLYQAQGSAVEHRKWWLYNRFKYLDSKYSSGDYENDYATMRIYTPSGATVNAVAPNPNFTITPIADQYCKVKYGSYSSEVRGYTDTPITIIAPIPSGTTFNDTETAIYGISRIRDIGSLADKYPGTVDMSKAVKLEKLIIGSSIEGYNNPNLGAQSGYLNVGNSKLLRIIDIQNCSGLNKALDVSECTNIREIYARGSAIPSVKLSTGGNLRIMQLPNTISNLTILNQPQLSTGFTIESITGITTIRIENCPGVNTLGLLTECESMLIPVLERVRIIGLGGTGNTNSIQALIKIAQNCHGMNENGISIDDPIITGSILITDPVSPSDRASLLDKFPELTITEI